EPDKSQQKQQRRQMQRIKPREPRLQERDIARHLEPRPIDMDQDEARQREKELDPEISLAHEQIDRPNAEIAALLAEMKQHQHQRRYSPGPVQRMDLGWTCGSAHFRKSSESIFRFQSPLFHSAYPNRRKG